MVFKPGRAIQKRYTHDEYQDQFFPSTHEPELQETETPYELGVRLGKRTMKFFAEGVKKFQEMRSPDRGV